MSIKETIITVHQTCGTYQTNTVRGVRASCTCGDEAAALALARKLYPGRLVQAEQVKKGSDRIGETHWRLQTEQAT